MALSQNQPVRVAIVRVAHSGEPKRSLIDGRARTPAGVRQRWLTTPPLFNTVCARLFCDQQEMSLQTATGRSLP